MNLLLLPILLAPIIIAFIFYRSAKRINKMDMRPFTKHIKPLNIVDDVLPGRIFNDIVNKQKQ